MVHGLSAGGKDSFRRLLALCVTENCLSSFSFCNATVRLEAESADGRSGSVVVHCYGHGGQGWTVHWGCALVDLELTTKGLLLGGAKL